MSQRVLEVGARLRDNDIRTWNGTRPRVLVVTSVDFLSGYVWAESSPGIKSAHIRISRIFTDPKPRKSGFTVMSDDEIRAIYPDYTPPRDLASCVSMGADQSMLLADVKQDGTPLWVHRGAHSYHIMRMSKERAEVECQEINERNPLLHARVIPAE